MNDTSLLMNQKESKEVRMSYWLLKLLSRDMKTKQKTKNKKKSNGTYSTRHEPLSQKWMDGDTNS